MAIGVSAARGYLDGATLAEAFAWLRPEDLVWRYWVNNYIQGRKPAPFDVLFWNADTTRMAAALHRDMVHCGLANALAQPDAVSMLGSPVDLSKISADTYVIAGIADHISPWQACYRSARLLHRQRCEVRAVHQRTHCLPCQSTRKPTRHPPSRATRSRGRRSVAAGNHTQCGLVVARLRQVVARAGGRHPRCTDRPWIPRASSAERPHREPMSANASSPALDDVERTEIVRVRGCHAPGAGP